MTAKHLHISDALVLPGDVITETNAILAKKGVGKTYLLSVLAEEIHAAGGRFVGIDTLGVLWGLRAGADGTKRGGLPVVIFGGQHADVPLDPSMGRAVADLVIESDLSIIVDMKGWTKADTVKWYTGFAERLYQANERPVHVLLDEADIFAPQKPWPDEQAMLRATDNIVRRGRVKGLGISMATQRPAVLNKDVLTQCDTLVALRVVAPQDREALDAWVKYNDDQGKRQDMLQGLASLGIGEAFVYSPGRGIFQRAQIRKRRTFDSSSTPKAGEARRAPQSLADVDLAKLRERFQAVVEKAKRDDPKELRAQIVALKKQLAAAQQAPSAKPVVERVEVPVITDKQLDELRRVVGDYGIIKGDLWDHLKKVNEIGMHLEGLINRARAVQTGAKAAASPAPRPTPRPAPPRLIRSAAPTPAGDEAALPRGERAVLTAIAQHDDGCDREQLTVLTGYKRSSRDSYLQRLREKGLIAPGASDTWQATEAGVAALGADFQPLPTGDELREHWLGKLPEGEKRVLEAVIAAWPGAASRDAIGEATGYKRSSRDSYIQRLRARRLVETDAEGVRASDRLFTEAG